ncbi:hypothetical protein GCM10010168_81190 [Actinoplanes ianthinogenes]|uniref:Uncharacterized protein n=1 Tax=Actinoplanes ianthinogenes TaxID=122358 RepID=A0ABM7LMN8_9ACTN|nr:hypothetical protein [Actinoplanes ianthinogenes]BCJ40547.1 hypothetical protein Aiant_12040 [Actinoplanes ianthinogenes]GGR50191.1 hypothetical protein GCM10010168_81190 [Actinoplanes ianthinogenes]
MEPDELMTDSDAEQERIARFRALPPRVRPDEMVELAETRSAQGRPASALTEDEQTVRYAAG